VDVYVGQMVDFTDVYTKDDFFSDRDAQKCLRGWRTVHPIR